VASITEVMTREINPFVYIMASQRNGTIYTGVTSNLVQRVWQHREGALPGCTRDHRVKLLVWFEAHATMADAISREKQIKPWKRAWKLALFEGDNPEWRDLAVDLGFEALVKSVDATASDSLLDSKSSLE
jgi:putative endonuclease